MIVCIKFTWGFGRVQIEEKVLQMFGAHSVLYLRHSLWNLVICVQIEERVLQMFGGAHSVSSCYPFEVVSIDCGLDQPAA